MSSFTAEMVTETLPALDYESVIRLQGKSRVRCR
jgi:hypothetical protein